MADFTEQFTAITFANQDGDKLVVKHVDDDCSCIEIIIGGNEFWLSKNDGEKVAEGIRKMCSEL